jgi:SAM-dependent methyltransferase
MVTRGDAYGMLLYDYHRKGRGDEIVERDDGFILRTAGVGELFAEYRHWPATERQAMRYVRGRVLDVGCGAGRACLHLQQKGFDVVGIDLSPLAVKVCKERGVRKCHVMDLRALDASLGTFDTVLLLGGNVSLLATRTRASAMLRKLHRLTSDRARIIASSQNPHLTKDATHLQYHGRNLDAGQLFGHMRIRDRYRDYASPWYDFLMLSKDELEALLDGSGWRILRFLDEGTAAYTAVIEKGT